MYPNGGMPLMQWLLSPLMRWHLASIGHKAVSLAAGAGVAYYTHTKLEWEPWKVAAAGLGTAYGTSLALHTVGGAMGGPAMPAYGMPGAMPGAVPGAMPGMLPQPQQPAQAPQPPPASNVVELRPEQRRAAAKAQPTAAEYKVPSNLNAATIPPPPAANGRG